MKFQLGMLSLACFIDSPEKQNDDFIMTSFQIVGI